MFDHYHVHCPSPSLHVALDGSIKTISFNGIFILIFAEKFHKKSLLINSVLKEHKMYLFQLPLTL